MEWRNLTSICEKEFRDGLPDSPATGVFDRNTDRGNKRWEDFKKRVVEHVSIFSSRVGLAVFLVSCDVSTP